MIKLNFSLMSEEFLFDLAKATDNGSQSDSHHEGNQSVTQSN